MEKGINTTEFKLTIAKAGIAILIATGVIDLGTFNKALERLDDPNVAAILNAGLQMVALIVGGQAVSSYNRSRAEVKSSINYSIGRQEIISESNNVSK